MEGVPHRWRFFRAGGVDQVLLQNGADLVSLGQLDQKLWVALACPTQGVEFDARTLAILDRDGDKRIRANDVIAAAEWMGQVLRNADDLLRGEDGVSLAAINDQSPAGKQVRDAARSTLDSLGKRGADTVTLEDAEKALAAFNGTPFNGDGVITAEATEDAELRSVIQEIGARFGVVKDRSGKDGIGQPQVDGFFQALREQSAWLAKADAEPSLRPLGKGTADGYALLTRLGPKLDDYFTRTRLAAFDPRALPAVNRDEKDYVALASGELSASAREVAAFPLSKVEPNRPLPLETGLNPAWADEVRRFAQQVVTPVLGERGSLSADDLRQLRERFLPYQGWLSSKAGAQVESLGRERIDALLSSEAQDQLAALLARDKGMEAVAGSLSEVEKLTRLHRDLFRFCNNFVSFRDFYGRSRKAMFQIGTLFLDQRSCELCVRADDAGKHATLAGLSRTYLAYCDCTRASTGEKMTIVAAFTAGDSDNLIIGRNGVFYDRAGKDWDATITRLIENPISVRQAFWAPYKKLVRFVEEQVAKRAGAAESARQAELHAHAEAVGTAASTGKPAPRPAFDVGVIAALGVAVGGITAALGAFLQAFFGLGIWMPIGAVGLVLAISAPSMVIAYLKLRQRNLGPLLDANGWAINVAARVNIPFGGTLTRVAALPAGASRDGVDPFAEKRRPWRLYVAVGAVAILAVWWALGKFDDLLPERVRSSTVLHKPPREVLVPVPSPASGPLPSPAAKP